MPTIVIDASLAVWAVLPFLSNVNALSQIVQWRQAAVELWAPALWLPECTSAIRRCARTGLILSADASIALEDIFALDVHLAPATPAHCRSALVWAERLGQAKAYDGFYLALAQELGATFFTADKRLSNGAQQLGISWVHWIGQ